MLIYCWLSFSKFFSEFILGKNDWDRNDGSVTD